MAENKIQLSSFALKDLIDCWQVGIGNLDKRYETIKFHERHLSGKDEQQTAVAKDLIKTRVHDAVIAIPIWVKVFDEIHSLYDWQNNPPGEVKICNMFIDRIFKMLEKLVEIWDDAKHRTMYYGEMLTEDQIAAGFKLLQLKNLFFQYGDIATLA
jgi:hypothetical protein